MNVDKGRHPSGAEWRNAEPDLAGDPRLLAKIVDKKQFPPPGEAGKAGWVGSDI